MSKLLVDEISDADGTGPVTVTDGIIVNGTIKLDGNYPVGAQNVALGDAALSNASTGANNTAVGTQSLLSNTGANNTGLGTNTLYYNTGSQNTALGASALLFNETASYNTAVGYQALYTNIDGGYSTAVGANALRLATGLYNDALGYVALGNNNTGTNNNAFGGGALELNTTGSYNTAFGRTALNLNITSSNNTAVGYQAGFNITGGDRHTAIGFQSVLSNTTGARNTGVGAYSLGVNQTGSDNVAIGDSAIYASNANSNTAVGSQAGYTNSTGTRVAYFGKDAGRLSTVSDNTFIGQSSGSAVTTGSSNTILGRYNGNYGGLDIRTSDNNIVLSDGDGNPRVRIDSNGTVTFVETASGDVTNGEGAYIAYNGQFYASTSSSSGHFLNVQSDNQTVLVFRHAGVSEGNVHINGSTVTYNGFSGTHESSGIASDTAMGTVCSTIDELDTYAATQISPDGTESNPKSGQARTDHAKIKVSDQEGDARVYGVLQGFDSNGKATVASVGIGSVRVTGACSGGDLLESNGDGTAKVQSDDIIRSKTIGKVTIGNSDTGVKLVSCVLYCG